MAEVRVGSRMVICSGSYAGRMGTVTAFDDRPGRVRVRVDRGPERTYRLISLRVVREVEQP